MPMKTRRTFRKRSAKRRRCGATRRRARRVGGAPAKKDSSKSAAKSHQSSHNGAKNSKPETDQERWTRNFGPEEAFRLHMQKLKDGDALNEFPGTEPPDKREKASSSWWPFSRR
jgi:hypothetical protein